MVELAEMSDVGFTLVSQFLYGDQLTLQLAKEDSALCSTA